jgi:hypothetical protein
MYILFDLGWDVPGGSEFDNARWQLGSQQVAVDKCPSCTGKPSERLRKLDRMTKRAGWKGAGLWIAAQAYGDGRDGRLLSQAEVESFFRERLRWSHEAGIEYWKMDYGARGNFQFRAMVTRWAKRAGAAGRARPRDLPPERCALSVGEESHVSRHRSIQGMGR